MPSDEHPHRTQIVSPSGAILWGLPSILVLPTLQSCSTQVYDHLAKQLSTTHKFLEICTPSFSFQAKGQWYVLLEFLPAARILSLLSLSRSHCFHSPLLTSSYSCRCFWLLQVTFHKQRPTKLSEWVEEEVAVPLEHVHGECCWPTRAAAYTAFTTCISKISYLTLPLDFGLLQCMPTFMVWWIRQYTVDNGQLRSHGSLVSHGQAFSLYRPGDVSQKETTYLWKSRWLCPKP